MTSTPALHWLPEAADWRERLRAFRAAPTLAEAGALARTRLDLTRTNALDAAVSQAFPDGVPAPEGSRPIRLAILGSSTTAHLHAGIRMGALRRGLSIATAETDYGLYLQALMDKGSDLHAFSPNAVLFVLDAYHLTAGLDASASAEQAEAALAEALRRVEQAWALARDLCGGPVLMQTPLPLFPPLMGGAEHRLPGSRQALTLRLNALLRDRADRAGVDILALDERAARDGLLAWHDPALWHRSKQEVTPAAAPVYGDFVARLLAARQGRSAKCLVLDLDNTLWGGVVGDDGTDRLVLGQGSAVGEAFVAVQAYAKDLARRGVILAVCSKNDEANAFEPFDRHPEMVLRRPDIACFVANWTDKAANLRTVAAELNIGLDSLVFLDDNPFERNLVRAELPMVAVPEVPEDPALVPLCLADAGYFESVGITADDRERTAQYRQNRERAAVLAEATDMPAYLRSLAMELQWRPFDRVGLTRITQLINKTNQFNLTTRRYTEEEVSAMMADPAAVTLQLRLLDRFGDNGTIAVVIGRMAGSDLAVDTWLMSCRVLGRGVEAATLAVLAGEARRLGARRLIGEYRPTPKNGMVREHYANLGFAPLEEVEGRTLWALGLSAFAEPEFHMTITGAAEPAHAEAEQA